MLVTLSMGKKWKTDRNLLMVSTSTWCLQFSIQNIRYQTLYFFVLLADRLLPAQSQTPSPVQSHGTESHWRRGFNSYLDSGQCLLTELQHRPTWPDTG